MCQAKSSFIFYIILKSLLTYPTELNKLMNFTIWSNFTCLSNELISSELFLSQAQEYLKKLGSFYNLGGGLVKTLKEFHENAQCSVFSKALGASRH